MLTPIERLKAEHDERVRGLIAANSREVKRRRSLRAYMMAIKDQAECIKSLRLAELAFKKDEELVKKN